MKKNLNKIFKPDKVAKIIVNYCLSLNKKFIFISGNGGAGKTELSNIIYKEANKYGHANVLSTDDFIVNTKLRHAAQATWSDDEKGLQTGKYTSSLEGSYFLQNIKAIIYNIEKGNNYYHSPKKARGAKECRLLYGDAVLTIVEGVGSVFLDKQKNNSISIFMQCGEEVEITRRIKKDYFSNKKEEVEVYKKFTERNSQYKTNIEPHKIDYKIEFESLKNFSLKVIKDEYDVFDNF